jgi:small subunit ribosomal protein S20
MPITHSATKAMRKDVKRAKTNRSTRLKLKKSLDSAKDKLTTGSLSSAYSAIDRAAKKHLIHKNKAARLKSQLAKKLVVPAKAATTPKAKVAKTPVKKPAKKPTPKAR